MMSLREYIESFVCMRVLCFDPSDQIDPMGGHWCRKHDKRRQLIRFGYLNGWPMLLASKYVLDAGYWYYQQITKWGKDEAIDALYEVAQCFVPEDEQEEEAA